jgi:Ca2+-binding RTX toxin-like protein
LTGTEASDLIRAGGGNDRVDARSGDDVVRAGRGNDLVVLGPGRDRSTASRGQDTVYGGPGPDLVEGAHFADLGGGRDRYSADTGSRGCLEVNLGRGNDVTGRDPTFYTGLFGCVVRGGPGADAIAWHGTDDPHLPEAERWSKMYGGPGRDVIFGGYNDDTIYGGPGADELHAHEVMDPDRVLAGKGDDELFFDLG